MSNPHRELVDKLIAKDEEIAKLRESIAELNNAILGMAINVSQAFHNCELNEVQQMVVDRCTDLGIGAALQENDG